MTKWKFYTILFFTTFLLLQGLLTGCSLAHVASQEEIKKAETHVRAAVLEMRQGRMDLAAAQFLMSQEFAVLPESLDGFGVLSLLRGDLEKALHFFHEAQLLDASYALAYAHEALAQEWLGNLQRAEALYEYALQLDPGDEAVRNDYALFLLRHEVSGQIGREGKKKGEWELRKALAISSHPIISFNAQRYGLQ